MGKKVGLIISFVIYLGVAFWGMGQGYSVEVSLCWPLGLLMVAAYGWAKLWRRQNFKGIKRNFCFEGRMKFLFRGENVPGAAFLVYHFLPFPKMYPVPIQKNIFYFFKKCLTN